MHQSRGRRNRARAATVYILPRVHRCPNSKNSTSWKIETSMLSAMDVKK
jgi:hypothetical protein